MVLIPEVWSSLQLLFCYFALFRTSRLSSFQKPNVDLISFFQVKSLTGLSLKIWLSFNFVFRLTPLLNAVHVSTIKLFF